jgi:hypothetical protein
LAGIDTKITEQQQRLEELKRRKAEAKGDLVAYDEASEAYMDAREQLRELRAQRSEAAKVQAQQMLENRERLESATRELVVAEYPDALIPGTDLYEACMEEMAYLKEQKSPLAADPQAHYKVARRMARAMGYSRHLPRGTEENVGLEASVGMRQGGAVPRRSVRPVPTGGQPVEPPLATLERRVSSARSMGEMLELMREIGTPFEALLKR